MDSSALLRMVIGLLLVIAAILLSAWLARRFGLAGGRNAGPRRQPLQLLASQALGPRHRLAIVAVEDARLVIGIGPQGMTLLHTLPAAAPGEADAAPAPQGSAATGFQAVLTQWLNGGARP